MDTNENTSIPTLLAEIEKLKKQIRWYELYSDVVRGDHGLHDTACEYADEETGVIQYPYEEGQTYWTLEEMSSVIEYEDNSGVYQSGALAVQSTWDDVSKDLHSENKEYFDSLNELLLEAIDDFGFIKVSCFDEEDDIEDGDYLVADIETGKFKKSY